MNPNRIPVALALAALIIGSSLALTYAQSNGTIGADSADRVIQVLIGLVLAIYANAAPKELERWRSVQSARRSHSAARFAGWSLTLAGLGYAVVWALAPIPVASVAGTTLVAAATLMTVAYAGRMYLQCRRDTGRQTT